MTGLIGLTSQGESELRDQLVRKVSRTFALSIEQLPGKLRESVGIAYLMFRVADSIEDHAAWTAEQKTELLHHWAAILQGEEAVDVLARCADLSMNDMDTATIRQAPLILTWFNGLPADFQSPIRRHVTASARGMARWQVHGPYIEDETALDDYMHEVAGRVGYLVTDLFALHSSTIKARREMLMPLSRHCGLALQTVNVIRGLYTDYQRGWVFIPQTYYEQFGLTRETLFSPQQQGQMMRVIELLAEKAERHLDFGLQYLTAFPRREYKLRLALMWPFFFAARTLSVCRGNPLVLTSEAKIDRQAVQKIVYQTRLLGWSNSWLKHSYIKNLSANGVPS